MKNCQVTFHPANLTVDTAEGSTIMEAINQAGLEFDFPCGGRQVCGKCRVKIGEGASSPTPRERELLEAEELDQGIRLACLTKVYRNLSVELPKLKLTHRILMSSLERSFQVQPHLKKVFLAVEPPSLQDHRSDLKRLKDCLVKSGYPYDSLESAFSLLHRLPDTLREAQYCFTGILFDYHLLGIEKQNTTGTLLGMAFDIGTTTIVGYLLDLYTGKELAAVSTLNPQTKFGADVISRITFVTQEEGGLQKLHAAVIDAINRLIGEASDQAGIPRQSIYALSIAANTTMHHLFLGINPQNIALSPYVSVVSEAMVVDAADLLIEINEAGKIFVLPNIAGFVGADTSAVLLATELDRSENIKLIIDIGTNGEIALGSKDRIVACSTAAGPAFEGAQISSGMRGAAGAIDHVYFDENLTYSVIGGDSPLGICGSALLDAVAGLITLEMIDKRGKFLNSSQVTNPRAKFFQHRIIPYQGEKAFLLAAPEETGHGRPILITQKDIRELQLAKGAIAAGIRILMENCGVTMDDIKEVLLAGAFGNYLDTHNACIIGLIPPELEDKIKMIGNAAGTGAKLALLSASEFRRADAIAASVKFIELGSSPEFNRIFAEKMYFNQNA
ncbi:MAG: ASKHA domain-containing protein [Dehalobacterium sp.]